MTEKVDLTRDSMALMLRLWQQLKPGSQQLILKLMLAWTGEPEDPTSERKRRFLSLFDRLTEEQRVLAENLMLAWLGEWKEPEEPKPVDVH